MKTVLKYDLKPDPIGQPQVVMMPKGAVPCWFGGPTYGWGRVWAIVDDTQQLEPRTFVITETGSLIPDDAEFIATVPHYPQVKAWHLFEIKPKAVTETTP